MALLTVGTLYTHPTITAAIAAAVSGDHIRVYATAGNQYPEDIADGGKQLDIAADDSEWMTQTIVAQGAASSINFTGAGSVIRGFILDGTAALTNGVYLGGPGSAALSMYVFGVTTGLARGITTGALAAKAVNCIVEDCGTGFMGGSSLTDGFYHCHARGCTIGIQGALGNWGYAILCTAVDNGTDFGGNLTVARSRNNASGDLSAPGARSVTGLLAADYDANYRLLAAVSETTLARFDGTPFLCHRDIDLNLRQMGGGRTYVYAGPSDPYVAPVGGAPICLGILDAQPWAQGCLLVRFHEMFCDVGTIPYRYDFHIKRLDGGVLTAAEINAGTYFSCAFYDEGINPDGLGSPIPDPAILSVVLALESPGDIGDNIHLMTNRRYYVAVRAVAIDAGDTIYEDDNDQVVISFSVGYQGITHQNILSWPCLELCADNPVQKVQITSIDSLPDINVAVTSLPDLELSIAKMPNLNVRLDMKGRK